MAGKLGLFEYISDDTVTYHVECDVSNANAVTHTATTLPARRNLPSGYILRKIEVVDDADVTGGRTPTRARRSIPIFDVTDAHWVGGTLSVSLPDFSVMPSVAVLWSISARIGEKRLNR